MIDFLQLYVLPAIVILTLLYFTKFIKNKRICGVSRILLIGMVSSLVPYGLFSLAFGFMAVLVNTLLIFVYFEMDKHTTLT